MYELDMLLPSQKHIDYFTEQKKLLGINDGNHGRKVSGKPGLNYYDNRR